MGRMGNFVKGARRGRGKGVYDEGKRVYDEAGNLKKGTLADFERLRELQYQDERAQRVNDFMNPEKNPIDPNSLGPETRASRAMAEHAEELRRAEEEGRSPYKYSGSDATAVKIKGRWRGIKKRAGIAGGAGVAGLVGGLGLFSTTLGPLEFQHISQMLRARELSSEEEKSDLSTWRIIRYVYYAKKGQVEKTRLGFLGNKLADRYAIRFESAGLKLGYTELYGFFDGFVIDRSAPQYRGLNDQQVADIVKEKYGDSAVVQKGSKFANPRLKADSLVIDSRNLNYRASRQLYYKMLRDAGAGRISSAIGTRVIMKRNGIFRWLFHPVKKVDDTILRSLDKLYSNARQRMNESFKGGNKTQISASSKDGEKSTPAEQANASDAASTTNETAQEAQQTADKIAAGDTEAVKGFSDSLAFKSFKVGAGVGGVLSLPCILDAIVNGADQLKMDLIQRPLEGWATTLVALGDQVGAGITDSGSPLDAAQLSPFHDIITSTNKDGTQSSFFDSTIINQSYVGGNATANKPDEGLEKLGQGTQFDFIKQEPLKSALAGVCSTEAQGALMALTFVTGPVGAIVGYVVSSAVLHQAVPAASKWIVGNPVMIPGGGAASGDNAAYGTRLMANDVALAHGGVPLTAGEEQQTYDATSTAQSEEFQSHNLAYRLFNPRDYRTPVARFIDHNLTNSALTNVASIFGSIFNIGHSFGSTLINTLSGKSNADVKIYEYKGIPKIGLSPDMLNDSRFQNPYEATDQAATLFESSSGQKYIDRAAKCMGVTISKDGGTWNATSKQNGQPLLRDVNAPECKERSTEWYYTIFFINYTTTGNELACWMGGETQACTDAGWSTTPTDTSGGTGAAASGGDARALAKTLLSRYPSKVDFQAHALDGSDLHAALQEIADTGAQKKCGTSIPINPDLLSTLVKLTDTYKVWIGPFAIGHECDGLEHQKGNAVDINGIEKDGVSTNGFLHLDALNSGQQALAKEFYGAVAQAFPDGEGGIGQYKTACWPGGLPPKSPRAVYFPDDCSHLHIDVRKH